MPLNSIFNYKSGFVFYYTLLIVSILIIKITSQQCDWFEHDDRFDCFPEKGSNKEECLNRGCCWSDEDYAAEQQQQATKIKVPCCFYSRNYPSYQVTNSFQNTESNNKNDMTYLLQKENSTIRPNEILKLEAKILFETKQRVRVQIYDPNNKRYQVPTLKNSAKVEEKSHENDNNNDYQIQVNKQPFSVQIFRKASGQLIFDSGIAPLIFADQFIQFSSILTNELIYGLGEHLAPLAHTTNWNSFSYWNRDARPKIDNNLYGAHPFYMSLETDGNAHGLFFLNSNAIEVDLQPKPAITFRSIGGIIDFYMYLGPTPADVIKQHTDLIGKTFMPPYFSLGFHLCKYGYNSEIKLKEIIRRNRDAEIPYDTQWSDIDAMQDHKDWTYDKTNFGTLPSIVKDLHDHGQHYINIIDPGISTEKDYYPYKSGLLQDVFIKNFDSDQPLKGNVWPGETVFPDFTNPNATSWWQDLAQKFHDEIAFDGIWIDMNELSNFVDGSIIGCTNSSIDNPPYTPYILGSTLYSKTICPSAQQYLSSQYNLHNMYGYFQSKATYQSLENININKRPFVLTRATFPGSGQYSAHWSGDMDATWDNLYFSIPNILEFNMYGVSMVGSDVCGFGANKTEELCIRWMQLGSFYPFMRNHNDGSQDQDPAAFSLEAQEIMKTALNLRYMLLPYLYTNFYYSHVYGETVVRPLFFEYINDKNTLTIDKQFLFGAALLISPVLNESAVTVDAYFPNDTWYQFENGMLLNTTGFTNLYAPLDKINIHVRGGFIIPFQYPAVTTTLSRKNPFGIIVALKFDTVSQSFFANGTLFWDDGESSDSISQGNYNLFNFKAQKGNLKIERIQYGYKESMILSDLKIFGVNTSPSNVKISNVDIDNFAYNNELMTLNIPYCHLDINSMDLVDILWF